MRIVAKCQDKAEIEKFLRIHNYSQSAINSLVCFVEEESFTYIILKVRFQSQYC